VVEQHSRQTIGWVEEGQGSRRAGGRDLPILRRRDHNREVVAHALQPLIDRPIPDIALPASDGTEFRFRQFVGERPLVLFFYLMNGTPG
jgi:hypothetical protein